MDLVASAVMNEALTALNIDSLGFCFVWAFLGAASVKVFYEMITKTIEIFVQPHNKHPVFTGGVIALHALFAVGDFYFGRMALNNAMTSCPNIFATEAAPETGPTE